MVHAEAAAQVGEWAGCGRPAAARACSRMRHSSLQGLAAKKLRMKTSAEAGGRKPRGQGGSQE